MTVSHSSRRTEQGGTADADDLARKIDEATREVELADPDTGRPPIDVWINRVVEALGVGVISAIVALVFLNAAGRYAFAAPILWGEELVIALIPWLAMTGVFLSVRRGGIIRIGSFVDVLPVHVRTALAALTGILSVLAFGYLAIYSYSYWAMFGRDPTAYLQLPTGLFTAAMPIGAAAVALAFAVETLRYLVGRTAGSHS
jgi:TRAP-type C4-dicarboxylate transport system permease small subunit